MKKFIGRKSILATPMLRGAYNDYRGWVLPTDENGSDEGYLVEYVDGGDSNHSDHKGYISWSPGSVFNNAYRPSETHIERMLIERDELQANCDKLHTFFQSDIFDAMKPAEKRDLLIKQLSKMVDYLSILKYRINLETK